MQSNSLCRSLAMLNRCPTFLRSAVFPVSRPGWLARSARIALVCAIAALGVAAPGKKDLQIYFVDVEGGQATLFVTPSGQSLLIDTGWPGNNGRDADRIVAAAKKAGLSKIDYVLITHFHTDHVGGLPQLAE